MCDTTSDVSRKQCKKCRRWLPEDRMHFFYQRGIPYSPCKECRGFKFTVTTSKKRKEPTRQGFAWCTQCDLELELTDFTVYKSGKVDSRCRSCRQLNKKTRRLQQPDAVRMEDKRHHERHREKRIQGSKAWREKNRAHAIDYNRKYNATPERRAQKRVRRQRSDVRIKEQQYQQNYNQRPEVIRRRNESLRSGKGKAIKIRRRARELGLPYSFAVSDWEYALAYFNNCCAVCGRPRGLWHTLAADHWIPLSAAIDDNPGTVSTNIIPLCHGKGGCNNSKGHKMPTEWLIRQFGRRKAKIINQRIEAFFKHLQK